MIGPSEAWNLISVGETAAIRMLICPDPRSIGATVTAAWSRSTNHRCAVGSVKDRTLVVVEHAAPASNSAISRRHFMAGSILPLPHVRGIVDHDGTGNQADDGAEPGEKRGSQDGRSSRLLRSAGHEAHQHHARDDADAGTDERAMADTLADAGGLRPVATERHDRLIRDLVPLERDRGRRRRL